MLKKIYLNKRVNLCFKNAKSMSFTVLLQGSQGLSSFFFLNNDFILLQNSMNLLTSRENFIKFPRKLHYFFPLKRIFNTFFTLFKNAILGVQYGFFKEFKLNGVGYYVWVDENCLFLDLGFGNIYKYELPDGIYAYAKKNKFFIYGVDKALVSNIASLLNKLRYPDVYKNKGLILSGKVYRKKDRIKSKK